MTLITFRIFSLAALLFLFASPASGATNATGKATSSECADVVTTLRLRQATPFKPGWNLDLLDKLCYKPANPRDYDEKLVRTPAQLPCGVKAMFDYSYDVAGNPKLSYNVWYPDGYSSTCIGKRIFFTLKPRKAADASTVPTQKFVITLRKQLPLHSKASWANPRISPDLPSCRLTTTTIRCMALPNAVAVVNGNHSESHAARIQLQQRVLSGGKFVWKAVSSCFVSDSTRFPGGCFLTMKRGQTYRIRSVTAATAFAEVGVGPWLVKRM